ncbi:MAG: rRNA pseudouridine synthase [Cohaesibacter sp.]|jgi:23S rRNA pseudouridine2605 synthase|nr:rRNA pseudouridine synthase [Cohaesibacter sp.]
MERKSAQKGRRSADARSPEGSENARRDGARKFTSGNRDAAGKSGKDGFKKGGFKAKSFKGDGRKSGPGRDRRDDDRPRRDRDDRPRRDKAGADGWSPRSDARKPNREEHEVTRGERSQRGDFKKDRKFSDRDRGPRRDRDDRPRRDRDDRGFGSKKSFDKRSYDKSSDKGGSRKHFDKRNPGPNRIEASDSPKPKGPSYTPPTRALDQGERIAKIMARSGLCSRRDAEDWIKAGRVQLNGAVLESPAVNVKPNDKVLVDGNPLPTRERTRLWLYHKPRGLVTTTSDPEGRSTVFEKLPEGLPRVITVGRLDINTEGLLLLTNDGGLARVLELPSTGWLRRYRVRAYGKVTQAQLDTLSEGIALEGVFYGAIDAQLEREVGDNVWITVALREGKNREVKKVLGHLGLDVNRLIRVSYGPFQLLDLEEGKVNEVRGRVLRDQLGERLVSESGADFDAPILTEMPKEDPKAKEKKERKGSSGGAKGGYLSAKEGARVMARDNDSKGGNRGGRDDRPNRGDRDDRGGRGDRGNRFSDNPRFAETPERKPFDPTAPRRTNYTFREDGADGKKVEGRKTRRVGGKPVKADLLDPNARLEGKMRKGGKGASGASRSTAAGKGRGKGYQASLRDGDNRGNRGGDRPFRKPHRGRDS